MGWKIKNKLFLRRLIEVIGFTSGIVTILLAFWDDFPDKIDGYEIFGFVGLVFIDVVIAVFMSWPKNRIKIKVSETVNANIYYGDIFEQDGITAIPVNEYFDTIADDKIISSNTLHGIFIQKVFGGNVSDLELQIKRSLSEVDCLGENVDRAEGNQLRYKLGTIAKVEKNGKIYFLVAFTRFNENNRAEVTKTEYQQIICTLFDFVEQHSQGFKLNLPLIGGGHSGVPGISKQKLLEFLIFAIQLNDKLTLVNGVDIVLHESLKSELNLNILEYYYSLAKS